MRAFSQESKILNQVDQYFYCAETIRQHTKEHS